MIRLLHLADLHIGMENYGRIDPATGVNGRVGDFLHRLDEVIDYGLDHAVDAVVFAGDAFKTRDPSPTHQREFARRIKRLADAHVPVVLLVGNHDLPVMENKASSLDIYRTLDVPGIHVGWRDEVLHLQTRHGPFQVACLPYPLRQRRLVHDERRGKTVQELDQATTDTLSDLVRGLAAEIDPAQPAVLAGHFSVDGAVFGSERSVMVGHDVVVQPGTLAHPAFDYVALGHIHKHQDLHPDAYPSIVYSGSLERIDFGEEHEPKGFCWVNLVRGATTWEFVEVEARPFVTIQVDVRSASDPMRVVLEAIAARDVSQAVTRLVIQLQAHQEAALHEREMGSALARAYYVSAIHKEIEHETRQRLGGQNPEELTPTQLLQHYFEARDTPPQRIRELLECAQGLIRP